MRARSLAAAIAALLGGCRDRPAPAAPAAPPVAAPPIEQGLLAELGREAGQRPAETPTVEQVLSSLERAGIAIARRQQVLATPIGARYCVAAVSAGGLNMSICEFEGPAAAEAGRTRSQQAFKTIARRTLLLRGKTLLTLIVNVDTPLIRAQAERAQGVFTAL